MNVRMVITVDDKMRAAIRHHWGKPGLATRDEVRSLYMSLADADFEQILSEYESSINGG